MKNLSSESLNVEIPVQELDEVIFKALKKGQRHIRFRVIKNTTSIVAITLLAFVIWSNISPSVSLAMILTKAQNTISSKIFGENNKAIEKAVENDYIQPTVQISYVNGVETQLTHYLTDNTKLALSFNLRFDNPELLEDIQGLTMDLEIKDEKDKVLLGYMNREIPKNPIITSTTDNFKLINNSEGLVQYNYIANSTDGSIPEINKLKISIQSIHYFNSQRSDSIDAIDGNWTFEVDVNDKFKNIAKIDFSPEKSNELIKIIQAETTPTGTLIRFSAPKDKDIDIRKDLFLIDELGNAKNVTGVVTMEDDNQGHAIYSVTFPVTSYDNPDSFTLVIKNPSDDKDLEVKMNKLD